MVPIVNTADRYKMILLPPPICTFMTITIDCNLYIIMVMTNVDYDDNLPWSLPTGQTILVTKWLYYYTFLLTDLTRSVELNADGAQLFCSELEYRLGDGS